MVRKTEIVDIIIFLSYFNCEGNERKLQARTEAKDKGVIQCTKGPISHYSFILAEGNVVHTVALGFGIKLLAEMLLAWATQLFSKNCSGSQSSQ